MVEVVSNREGGEAGHKLEQCARIGVPYQVIFDPAGQIGREPLRVFRNSGGAYRRTSSGDLPRVNLSLRLWEGTYEGLHAVWLRWVDAEGRLVLTGAERAQAAEARAERLAAQLRAPGVEPER